MIYFIHLKITLFLFLKLNIKAKPSNKDNLGGLQSMKRIWQKYIIWKIINLHSCLIFPVQQIHIQIMNSPLIHFKIFFKVCIYCLNILWAWSKYYCFNILQAHSKYLILNVPIHFLYWSLKSLNSYFWECFPFFVPWREVILSEF